MTIIYMTTFYRLGGVGMTPLTALGSITDYNVFMMTFFALANEMNYKDEHTTTKTLPSCYIARLW